MISEIQKTNLAKLNTQYNLEHLRLPPEVYELQYPQPEHFQPTSTGDKRRRIYYKVKYQPKQEQAIQEAKKQLRKKGLTSYKISDEVILKHVYMGGWKTQKIVQRLKQVMEFNMCPKATTFTALTLQKLKKGQIYTYGCDKKFRPNVIMKVDKFDLSLPLQDHLNAFYFLMLVVLGCRMVPYHAEKYNFFMDLNNISIPDLPLRYLYSAMQKIGLYYCGNSQKTFIFNAEGVGNIWKIISFFLPQSQKRRVIFVPKGQEHIMLEHMDPYELERRYGGKLPNLTEYWPPKSTSQAQFQLDKTFAKSEFYSVNNDQDFFRMEGETKEGPTASCQCNIY